MPRVFVDGQHGTAGLRLGELLAAHPLIEPLELPHHQRRDVERRRTLMAHADLVALCLPRAAVAEALSLAPVGGRIIDASNEHRCDDDWVYGLPELGPGQREAIREASQVTNPGCFATGFVLAVRPLVDAGIVSAADTLHCHAITGYSAGGARMIARFEGGDDTARMCSINLDHRHLPEMQRYARMTAAPVLLPSIGSHAYGMHLTVTVLTNAPRSELLAAFSSRYETEPFVHVVRDPPTRLSPAHEQHLNHVEIYVSGTAGRYLVSVRLHNLMKGAAGAMVQNMNLMLGLEENLGLA